MSKKDEGESFHPFSFKRIRRNAPVLGLLARPKHPLEEKKDMRARQRCREVVRSLLLPKSYPHI